MHFISYNFTLFKLINYFKFYALQTYIYRAYFLIYVTVSSILFENITVKLFLLAFLIYFFFCVSSSIFTSPQKFFANNKKKLSAWHWSGVYNI